MRLTGLRAQLDEHKLDAMYVTHGHNRRYLTGFTGSAGHLLVTRERAQLLTDSRYWEQAAEEAPTWELVKVKEKPFDALHESVQALNARRIGFESQDLTVDGFTQLREALDPGIEWVPVRGAVERLRWEKDAREVETLKRAIALTDDALAWLLTWLQPGVTEHHVAWALERYMREHGAERLSFDTIVASGPNSARPHAHPTERVILAGEPITIDMGAVIDGYHADLTRTLYLGVPDEKFMEIYNLVLTAQKAALLGLRVGMNGKVGDALARDIIAAAGHGEHFGHSLGHGVGLVTHEGPRLSVRADEDILPVGATVTVEPGVYVPGWGGVRIEDVVLITAEGPIVLSHATKEPGIPLAAQRMS